MPAVNLALDILLVDAGPWILTTSTGGVGRIDCGRHGHLVGAVTPSTLIDSTFAAVRTGRVAGALVFVGPGGLSIDARLFGRREIIIPPAVNRKI